MGTSMRLRATGGEGYSLGPHVRLLALAPRDETEFGETEHVVGHGADKVDEVVEELTRRRGLGREKRANGTQRVEQEQTLARERQASNSECCALLVGTEPLGQRPHSSNEAKEVQVCAQRVLDRFL